MAAIIHICRQDRLMDVDPPTRHAMAVIVSFYSLCLGSAGTQITAPYYRGVVQNKIANEIEYRIRCV